MKNIFVPDLTVKAADKMEIYETYRIRNEIKGQPTWKVGKVSNTASTKHLRVVS